MKRLGSAHANQGVGHDRPKSGNMVPDTPKRVKDIMLRWRAEDEEQAVKL